MKLIDTHAHLFLPDFAEDIDAVVERARQFDVHKIYLPNIDSATLQPMYDLQAAYPDMFEVMIGLHPGSVNAQWQEQLAEIECHLRARADQVVAIGEIGLDFYWSRTFEFQQRQVFEIQLQWAAEMNLPVVLHTRNSFDATLEMIYPYLAKGVRGVFHCFTGDYEAAKRALNAGFYLGIGGIVTFQNSRLIEMIQKVGLDHIVLETDAPYLSPYPHRGRRNESAHVRIIANFIAERLNVPIAAIAQKTTANARRVFRK